MSLSSTSVLSRLVEWKRLTLPKGFKITDSIVPPCPGPSITLWWSSPLNPNPWTSSTDFVMLYRFSYFNFWVVSLDFNVLPIQRCCKFARKLKTLKRGSTPRTTIPWRGHLILPGFLLKNGTVPTAARWQSSLFLSLRQTSIGPQSEGLMIPMAIATSSAPAPLFLSPKTDFFHFFLIFLKKNFFFGFYLFFVSVGYEKKNKKQN